MTLPAAKRQTLTLGPCHLEYRGNDDTQLLGVVGHPVAHSLSPRMQQAALDAAGCNLTYVAMDVSPQALAPFVQQARHAPGPLRGFNVTIPHKTAIVELLDTLDEDARLAAAVNTVVIEAERRLQGYNTDVVGLQEVWRQHNITVRDRKLVVIGAGGLARAAVVAGLHEAAAEICVLNRTLEHAQAMLDDVSSRWQGRLPRLCCAAWGEDVGPWLADASSLVQATPVGMGKDDPAPVSLRGAGAQLFVLESLYGPPTRLLQQAARHHLSFVDGRSLLVAQGAAAWRLWMHAQPDIEAMRQALSCGPDLSNTA